MSLLHILPLPVQNKVTIHEIYIAVLLIEQKHEGKKDVLLLSKCSKWDGGDSSHSFNECISEMLLLLVHNN